MIQNLLDRFSKNTQISNFMKVYAVGAEVYYTDRETDITKLIFFFAIFQMHLITTNPAQKKQILLNKESITKPNQQRRK
jgi:hypothetical protein